MSMPPEGIFLRCHFQLISLKFEFLKHSFARPPGTLWSPGHIACQLQNSVLGTKKGSCEERGEGDGDVRMSCGTSVPGWELTHVAKPLLVNVKHREASA